MGLDMYLNRQLYVQHWDHIAPEHQYAVSLTQGGKPVELINPKYITDEVGYWRKANQIHKWIIDNCANGNDDAITCEVSREDLVKLLDTVRQVMKPAPDGLLNRDLAEELLPTTEGFFFGSTDYDEWYLQDLKLTEEILVRALALEDDYFEYVASW